MEYGYGVDNYEQKIIMWYAAVWQDIAQHQSANKEVLLEWLLIQETPHSF